MATPNEEAFEAEICAWLTAHGGYDAVKDDKAQGADSDFDRATGLDRAELLTFLGATQPREWDELVKRYRSDPDQAQVKFRDRLAAEVDKRGVVDVLRHGVRDQGVRLRLAYFRPAHGLSEDLVAKYAANRLTVTRQLRHQEGSGSSLDLALLVNGIPVATAELKNPLTGQGAEQAMRQYRTDRDPKNRTLAQAVVHFAVDPQRVAMTTRLAGNDTRFLPFNRGHNLGPGNPPSPGGHATAYLWQRVWAREAWLDLLGRFVHVEKPGRGSKKPATVIFPRFHQWDAVRGLGQVQHHRLAGAPALHPPRRRRQGVRQGRRHHRPGGARPAAAGHHLPVRAHPRRGGAHRARLGAAGGAPTGPTPTGWSSTPRWRTWSPTRTYR